MKNNAKRTGKVIDFTRSTLYNHIIQIKIGHRRRGGLGQVTNHHHGHQINPVYHVTGT